MVLHGTVSHYASSLCCGDVRDCRVSKVRLRISIRCTEIETHSSVRLFVVDVMSKRDVALWDDDGSAVPNKIESRQKQQVLTLLQSANDYSNENQVVKYQIQSKSGSDLSVLSSLPLPAD